MEVNKKYIVLVTGFGPFDNHIVNASWEAAKELSKLCIKSKELMDVEVIVKEIPVSYEDVTKYVPKFWQEYKPIVVLHLGVSRQARCLTIECRAHSNGYLRKDIFNKCPDESNIESEIFETKINAKQICNIINESSDKTKCNACISYNAGRYLCEYIFYKSLQIAPKRTLFVHVPDFNQYSSVQSAKGLYEILYYIIEDMKKQ
ncbi:pyroglutamyl-peptidase 1 isoform X1 [Bombus pascuorum]|uniref:pyroglutamyl-peptidase 1 isoform X1 n=1 Tax=Bombus pascuorum TaxID=65598 RepID=UPI0021270B18|nr:pyroglutamyl-peptidase 1 isoform X1 [Bombus pascuorum]